MTYVIFAHTLSTDDSKVQEVDTKTVEKIATYLTNNCLRSKPTIDYDQMTVHANFPTIDSMNNHMKHLRIMLPDLYYNVWKTDDTELDTWHFPEIESQCRI